MAMRLGISCYVFPKVRSRLCFQRPFFRFSVDRHAHSLRYSLPTSTSSGRLRCLTSSRRRKFAVSALPNVDQEADDFEDVFEPRRSQGRNGADVHSDAGDIGTSGRTGSQGSRGRRSSGRGGYQRPSWMQGWDDGQTVGTRDSDLKYGSQGDNWDGDHRSRIVDRSHTSRADDWKRSDFGSDKSSSDARRDAFARFLRRDTGPETEKISSPEWDRETGFYPEDSRTGRTTPKSNSAWARLSKKLSDVPTQDTGEWSDWVGGKNQLSTSPSSPDDLSPTQDKSVGPLPPLSKFFPDSIINPFSNPPPIKSRGFFSQIESDKELAATGRKLGEDLWGKANELRSSSYGADRFASKSVGSRSVPSKPSIPGRHSKYTAKQSRGNRQLFSTSAPVVENSYVTAPSESESPSEETTPGAAVDYRQNEEASSSSVSTNSTYQGKYSDGSVGSEEPDGNVPGSSSYSVSNDSLEDQSANPLEEPSVNRVSSLIVPPSLAPRPSSVSGAVIETFPSPIPTSLPFEFQYSYSEVPKAIPLKLRNKFSPFGPQTMDRPWTGKAPLKKSKKKLPEFDSFKPPPANKKGVKYVQQPGPFPAGQGPKPAKSREEILGEPLTKEEIAELVQSCIKEQRQLNLGRDGLTHNMLDLIHSHWKRRRCLKIKCKGVPTVDMDNLCFHLEDKTGGVIIQRSGGTIYLYRGRYYNYKDRPQIPLMLWKPLAPCYPKLVKAVPDGMTKEEVNELRRRGRKMEPLKKLNKNGVYLTLVQDIRDGFLFDDLVKLDCKGLNPSDYKKIGAKLKDMVPCVLLSFEKEQILVWKGRNLEEAESIKHPVADCGAESDEDEDDADNGSLESEHEISVDEAMDKVLDDETAAGAAWDEDFSVLKPTDHSVVGSVNGAQARGSEPSSYGSASGLQPGAGSEVRMMEYPSDLVKPENQQIQEILPLYIAETTSLEDPLLRAEQLVPPEFANNCSPSYQEPRPVPGVLVAEKSLPQAWPGNEGEQECTPLSDAVSKPEGEISVRQKQRERRKPRSHLDDLWNQAIESGEAVALDEPEAVDPDVLKETVKSLRSLEREQEDSTVHREVPDSNDKVQVRRKVKSDDLGITATMQRGLPVDELAKFLNRNLT